MRGQFRKDQDKRKRKKVSPPRHFLSLSLGGTSSPHRLQPSRAIYSNVSRTSTMSMPYSTILFCRCASLIATDRGLTGIPPALRCARYSFLWYSALQSRHQTLRPSFIAAFMQNEDSSNSSWHLVQVFIPATSRTGSAARSRTSDTALQPSRSCRFPGLNLLSPSQDLRFLLAHMVVIHDLPSTPRHVLKNNLVPAQVHQVV
jgi:hypothetical protein